MKAIWKYQLEPTDSQTVVAPEGAVFISVIEQYGMPTLYALVDPQAPTAPYNIQIRGTGHPVEEDLLQSHVFLGTVLIRIMGLVWHVFVPKGDKYQG